MNRPGPRLRALVAAAVLMGGLALPIAVAPPASAEPHYKVPSQWISKLYTEAFGRAPHADGWATLTNYFIANPCNTANTSYWGKLFFKDAEMNSLYALPDPTPDNHILAARIVALWRGGLNREPGQAEFDANWNLMKTTETAAQWNAIVDMVFNSSEFNSLVSSGICAGTSTKRDPSAYGWNTSQQPPVGTYPAGTTCGMSGAGLTRASLQTALNNAPAGGTVYLAQNANVYIDAALVIPAGKTLKTCGPANDAQLPDPLPSRYALQARIIRTWDRSVVPNKTWPTTLPADAFATATVLLEPGAHLDRVWVDGNRDKAENYCHSTVAGVEGGCLNVAMKGGSGTSVTYTRQDNSGGWSHIVDFGGHSGTNACSGVNTISNNLVAAYASSHVAHPTYGAQWSDGISTACENTNVTNNVVIDASDVPIIMFRPCIAQETWCWSNTAARVQQSDFTGNTVLAAGNSNWGAMWISTDESTIWKPAAAPIADYTGATITGNHIWTSVSASMHALVVLGARTISVAGTSRTVPNGSVNVGSQLVTSSSGNFTSADVGKNITGTGIPAGAQIIQVNSATAVVIDVAATATASGVTLGIGPGSYPDWATRGTGAVIQNNDTNGQIAYVNVAVIESGMRSVTLSNNNFDLTRVAFALAGGLTSSFPGWKCGAGWLTNDARAPIIVEQSSAQGVGYWASGTFGPNVNTTSLDMGAVLTDTDGVYKGCMTAQMHV